MESRTEFEGRSLEEAVARASEALGIEASDIRYEIIEDGRRGFLGIGTRPVKIRVMSKAEMPGLSGPPPSGERARSGGGSPDPGMRGESRRGNERGGGAPSGRGPSSRGGPPRGGRGGRQGDRPRQAHHGVHPGGTRPPSRDEGLPIGTGIPEGAPYSNEEAVRLVAGQILREMGFELRARLSDRDDAIVLELGGTDASILLENDGEVIEALQHILNKILSRDERFESRVVVDCEGFRSRHDEATIERAHKAAEEALRTGKPVHLEGLNPYERRLAHIALAENKAIRTYSTGDGTMRTLTIEPSSASADEA
jgi:spoIIIJ-associated protein